LDIPGRTSLRIIPRTGLPSRSSAIHWVVTPLGPTPSWEHSRIFPQVVPNRVYHPELKKTGLSPEFLLFWADHLALSTPGALPPPRLRLPCDRPLPRLSKSIDLASHGLDTPGRPQTRLRHTPGTVPQGLGQLGGYATSGACTPSGNPWDFPWGFPTQAFPQRACSSRGFAPRVPVPCFASPGFQNP
jgi:hypothetical protein